METTQSRFFARAPGASLGLALGVALLGGAATAQSSARTFTHDIELDRLGVQAQGNSGTCWSFATVSFLESELDRIHGEAIDLSEMYPVYFAYVEKAKRYVEKKGKAQFGQGGLCHDVFHTLRDHGIAPVASYDGLVAGSRGHNHGEMEAMLKAIADVAAKGRPRGDRWVQAYRGVLDAYLGEVPSEIEVDGKTMSVASYTQDVLGIKADEYLTMMSYESQPFWTKSVLEVPDNWMRYDEYLNVPIEDAMRSLDAALAKGFTVAIDIDVSERGFQARSGVASLPKDQEAADFQVTDGWRQETFASGDTTDDHLMHIVGIATDENGGKFYITKNSWGERIGPFGGNLYMSRKYVAAKMLSFAAHKDAFDAELLGKIKP